MSQVYLSIIIPAFNEEQRLPTTCASVLSYIKDQPFVSEVLIVENGSQDRTLEIARDFAAQHPEFHVIQIAERGKGRAVQNGMLAARGVYRFMCDADLSMPIEEINLFLPPAAKEFDVAIGSREAPGSVRFNEPVYRHLGGRIMNNLIRVLALPGLQDTQCGFKCFRASVAEDLFRCQTLPGWSFDIEVLYVARKRGYRITEVPIHWYFNPESKLSAVRDALHMVSEIFKIRRNDRTGIYG